MNMHKGPLHAILSHSLGVYLMNKHYLCIEFISLVTFIEVQVQVLAENMSAKP